MGSSTEEDDEDDDNWGGGRVAVCDCCVPPPSATTSTPQTSGAGGAGLASCCCRGAAGASVAPRQVPVQDTTITQSRQDNFITDLDWVLCPIGASFLLLRFQRLLLCFGVRWPRVHDPFPCPPSFRGGPPEPAHGDDAFLEGLHLLPPRGCRRLFFPPLSLSLLKGPGRKL